MHNSLTGVRYVEPYAGGASIALSLLFEGYVSKIHINDLNRGVFSFWNSIINHTDEFSARIKNARLTMDEWQNQRSVYHDPDSEEIDLAFSSFYLNRTNRSGIISGGVIGGNNQTGKWKIDARFNKDGLIERVQKIAERGSDIEVTMFDAVELVRKEKLAPNGSLLYLDPPYYVKGSRLYDNFYSPKDHASVAHEISTHPGPWIVSYDAAPEIIEMYPGCSYIQYSLGYSAATAGLGTEVMFFSDGVSRPDVPSPAGLTLQDVKRFGLTLA